MENRWTEIDRSRAPVIDGEELPDGYGISFEASVVDDEFDYLIGHEFIKPGPTLVVWMTKRNLHNGHYEKYMQIRPGATILCWDIEGRAWEYEHGILEVTEDKLNLEEEYGDE